MKKLVFLLAVVWAAASFSAEKNLVKNGGFENINGSGNAVGWGSKKPIWTISNSVSNSGKRSLYYNNNTGKYNRPVYRVKLKPGRSYEFGAVIRNSGKVSPNVCMEWHGNGKYIGGSYNAKLGWKNGEWQSTKGFTKPIPKGVTEAYISCLVSIGANGKLWFDDVYVREYSPSLFESITTNQYRNSCISGKVCVFVGVNKPAGSKIDIFKSIHLQIIGNDGKTKAKIAPESIKGNVIKYSFDAEKLDVGDFTLKCEAENPASKKQNAVSLLFSRVTDLPKYKVYVDQHKRIIVDKKPFFPLGMYFSKVIEKDLKIFSNSAFNCIMPYIPPADKDGLDMISKYGLKLFYTVGHYNSLKGKKNISIEKWQKRGIKYVNKFKEHSAIIGWYINDELDSRYLNDVTMYRRRVEKADPQRPTWSVLCRMTEVRRFVPSIDIVGTDPYPIGKDSPKLALNWTRKTNAACYGTRMLIQVIQAFPWGYYWAKQGASKAKVKQGRKPTYSEMRVMSWMCIAGGANGIFYYSWSHIMNKGKVDSKALAYWSKVKKIAQEIKNHENVLLSVEKPMTLKIKSDSKLVQCRVYALDGTTWVLAVNADAKASHHVKVKSKKMLKLLKSTLGESKPTVDGKNLTFSLKPLETLFVCIKDAGIIEK